MKRRSKPKMGVMEAKEKARMYNAAIKAALDYDRLDRVAIGGNAACAARAKQEREFAASIKASLEAAGRGHFLEAECDLVGVDK